MNRLAYGIGALLIAAPCFAGSSQLPRPMKQEMQKKQQFVQKQQSERAIPRMVIIRTRSVGQGADMIDEEPSVIEVSDQRELIQDDDGARALLDRVKDQQAYPLQEGAQEGAPQSLQDQFRMSDSIANDALEGGHANRARFHFGARLGGSSWFVGTGTRGYYGYSPYRSYYYPSYGYWSGTSYYPYTYSYSYPYGDYNYYYYYNPYYGW